MGEEQTQQPTESEVVREMRAFLDKNELGTNTRMTPMARQLVELAIRAQIDAEARGADLAIKKQIDAETRDVVRELRERSSKSW